MVLPTCPNKFALGSQKILSKQRTTLFRLPKPKRWIAATFQSGSGGTNWTELGMPCELGAVDCLRTPRGRVQRTTSAVTDKPLVTLTIFKTVTKSKYLLNSVFLRQPSQIITTTVNNFCTYIWNFCLVSWAAHISGAHQIKENYRWKDYHKYKIRV